MNLVRMTRPAVEPDRRQLAELLQSAHFLHYHLDWRQPLDWIGSAPFLVLEENGLILGALSCPPDPPRVAWLRLFVTREIPPESTWRALWPFACQILGGQGGMIAAAIAIQKELKRILEESGFSTNQELVFLEKNSVEPEELTGMNAGSIRSIVTADLPAVEAVDASAFAPLWHNALSDLTRAHARSYQARLVEVDGQVAGYQISTRNTLGVHLARLAVRPDLQGLGLGEKLVRDLITRSVRGGIQRFTVNTQNDNAASLALYRKLGFSEIGEHYPVYTCGIL